MSSRRFLASTLLLLVVSVSWNSVVHLVVLRQAEETVRPIFRSDVASWWWLSLLQTLALLSLFIVAYSRFRRTGTLLESLSFGLFAGLTAILLVDVNQFVLYPLPATLVSSWALFGLLEFVLYGVLLWWIHSLRPTRSAS